MNLELQTLVPVSRKGFDGLSTENYEIPIFTGGQNVRLRPRVVFNKTIWE